MDLNFGVKDKIEIYNYDTENPNLKPCPFCGSTPLWHLKGNDSTPSRTIIIKCPGCGVEMKMSGRSFLTQPVAIRIIEKWNKRNERNN